MSVSRLNWMVNPDKGLIALLSAWNLVIPFPSDDCSELRSDEFRVGNQSWRLWVSPRFGKKNNWIPQEANIWRDSFHTLANGWLDVLFVVSFRGSSQRIGHKDSSIHLNKRCKYFLGCPTSQNASGHQDHSIFRLGDPEINLFFPLSLGGVLHQ